MIHAVNSRLIIVGCLHANHWKVTRHVCRRRVFSPRVERGGEQGDWHVQRHPAAKPERFRRKRGARPSRSLRSASRRTAGAAYSTHRLVRQDECCQLVGGTPTGAVETTALPIFNCIDTAKTIEPA